MPTRERNRRRPLSCERMTQSARFGVDRGMAAQQDGLIDPYGWRNTVAFFLLGLLNNACYVIMIAGAPLVSSGSVGLVFLCAVVPGIMAKASAPYWFHMVSYDRRISLASLLMAMSFLMVGLGSSRSTQLLGVVCAALQSSLGEASCLALSSRFGGHTSRMITFWSSGTGCAGIFGYAWVAGLHVHGGISFRNTLLWALVLPIVWLWCYFRLLKFRSSITSRYHDVNFGSSDDVGGQTMCDSDEEERRGLVGTGNDSPAVIHGMSARERLSFILGLWPYTVPLFLVYFAEYAMQSGVWISIGFPVEEESARRLFYTYANWCYQLGVFVSRSSGTLWQAGTPMLWLMPILQVFFLVFFTIVSMYHVWYNWVLLLPAFGTGLLGGFTYVNAFIRISQDIAPNYREFSLAAASVADSIGVAVADIVGIMLQGCLYKWNGIAGADFSC